MEKLPSEFLDNIRNQFKRDFYWASVAVMESQFPESWLSCAVHKPLCSLISDPKNTRVAVILPRDWLKSQVCSIYYPIWRAMNDPLFTAMITQNTFTNATKKLSAIRSSIRTNQILRAVFPERMPDASCQQSIESLCLPRTVPLSDATFEAAGVGTDVTSRHLALLIEDDTIAPEFDKMTGDVYEPSEEQVEKAIGFHRSAHFLLHDLKTSQRLIVGTRWRERDLFSWIQNHTDSYKFMVRAVREDEDGKPHVSGELTYPERFDNKVLEELYHEVGDYMFNALMMSTPLNAKDAIFHEEDILYYESPPTDLQVFTTVDPASVESKGSDPDYNVVLTAGISPSGKGIFVLDYFRQRCTPKDTIDAIFKHVEAYNPLVVGIEIEGYQKTLKWWLQEFQNKRRLWFNIEELRSSGRSKPKRIHGLQPIVANHQLHIKKWMTDLKQELVAHPRGAHDDIIDALAYQKDLWKNTYIPDEKVSDVTKRFTGAYLLEELRGRLGRPEGYPYDVMGVTKDGHDLLSVENEIGAHLFTKSLVIGGLGNRVSYEYN